MPRTILEYNDRIKSYFQHENNKPVLIVDPIGLDESEKEMVRHKTYHGIFISQSSDIKFVKDGRRQLIDIYNQYGVNAQVRFWIEERHPKTDEWIVSSDGFLGMRTIVIEKTTVSFKYDIDTLLKTIKSRESQKVEVERLDTIDGDVMPHLQISKFLLEGRKIYLKSLLETKEEDDVSDAFRMTFKSYNSSPSSRTGALVIPTAITYKSDVLVHSTYKNSFTTTPNIGIVEGLFYAINDVEKTLKLNIKVSCRIKEIKTEYIDNPFLKVDLVRYNNGNNYDLLERMNLYTVPNFANINNHVIDIDFNTDIVLLAGESLALQWYGGASSFGNLFHNGDLDLDFIDTISSINIEEDSSRDSSQANCILPYELFDRLLFIMTGSNDIFYSEALGRTDLGYSKDGFGALLATIHGHWARGFTDTDERYKAFTTSFKDLTTSYFALLNLGIGVEKIGFKQQIRVESLDYFYNRNTTVRLGKYDEDGNFNFIQVSNEKTTIIEKELYSEIEIGSEKGGEYEEAMGLDEPNTKTTISTVIKDIKNIYKAVSKYRSDSYGLTFAQRLQKEDNPTKDSKYDKHIWVVDLKRHTGSDVLELKKWADDFEELPTGIYSPETAFNLVLSPVNTMLIHHSWKIAGALLKYPNDFLRYGSSVANSNLTTKLRADLYPVLGGVARSESGSPIDGSTKIIQNSNLHKAISEPEYYEFDFVVDYDIREQIEGTTTILGDKIPNMYGVFEFKSEDGTIKKGHLMERKGTSSFKLKKLADV